MSKETSIPLTRTFDDGKGGTITSNYRWLRFPVAPGPLRELLGVNKESGHHEPPPSSRRRRNR